MFMFLHNSTQSKQMTTLQSLGSAGGSSHRGVFPGHCGIMFALEGLVGFLFEESHGVMHPARSDFFSWKGPFFFSFKLPSTAFCESLKIISAFFLYTRVAHELAWT